MTRRLIAVSITAFISLSLQRDVPAVERPASQTTRARAESEIPPSGYEFPPQDRQVLSLVTRGAAAKLATRRLRDSPDTPETIRLLATQERADEMLPALQLLVRNHPERMTEAFELLLPNMYRIQRDDTRGYKARLAEIVAAARKQAPNLPVEAGARAERVLLDFDGYLTPPTGNRDAHTLSLTNFIQTHPGTEAALLAEVDVLTAGGVSLRQLDALASLARAHPRTVAAAKATYLRGFNLAVNVPITGIEKRGSDPTDRFMQVLDIVGDLESGAYPPCEWVDRAASIVWQFFTSNPAYSPENLERVLTASYEFVKTHFTLAENPAENSIGYFVTSKLPPLMKARGDEIAGMESMLSRLERDVSDPSAVRYLKTQYYLRSMRESQSDRVRFLQKAIDALSELQAQGRGLYHRKALATLAAVRSAERDFVNARSDLVKYFQIYPDSDWAWVAALRAGLCDQELGSMKDAAATHLAASAKYSSNPLARVLGHAYAARAYEGQGQFDIALREYQKALDGWDNDYGPAYSLYLMRSPRPTDSFGGSDGTQVLKNALPDRIAHLKQSLAQPGGALLERGRWLLEREQRQDAIATLKQLLADRRPSGVAAEARYLMHRAQLEMALDLADADSASDEASATKALDSLGHEPLDFAVTVAKIAKASLLWKKGATDAESSMMMMQALDEWHAQQRMAKPGNGLEQDVADIRAVAFLPKGGAVFGSSSWNAFDWPGAAPPFAIVNPNVRVKLANGEIVQVSVKQPLRTDSKVLFLDNDQLGLLRATMVRLGGSRRRVPTGVMETPNQPVGAAIDILALWKKFFPARPGHWGGWDLETYPVITEIAFIDAARTRAEVAVTIGYSGATVVLEKEGSAWTAKRLINQWIT
jgi:tetratricopeptide (TPR) repeat protein